ncbi:YdaS family helix-turn-helix protein [Bradyrhizobium sp. WD16]|uniref:transcriptional regulator n=1 Tax=Bradyrhizobium sp. WD16 TaxID=1521768 RepID=UPI0020A4F586|nr:YdaS family helix-turn-helix protein [Bradyrhizobium sp. WD16]UTD28168.1 transcriptional regulator [Bradyrhizobium sp. WD16]
MSNHPDDAEPPCRDLARQALQQACAVAGGQKPLALQIGTTQSRVWYWLARARHGVAAEFVLPIERATGVSRRLLRPDLFSPDQSADRAPALPGRDPPAGASK